jgi:hypothetical protein
MVPLQTSSRHRSGRRRLAPLLGAASLATHDQGIMRLVLETRPDVAVIPGVLESQ